MTTGTRNIINRLIACSNKTQEDIRRTKAWTRTPWDQRPSASGSSLEMLKDLASLLCATRAEMRGKQHFKDPKYYLTPSERTFATPPTRTQTEWITKQITDAEKLEKIYKEPRPHQTLPLHMRNMIKAALEAAKLEPARREERQKRYLAHKAKKPAA